MPCTLTKPSSQDLHPRHGGRFVFARQGEAEPPVYSVEVYLPADRCLRATLRWTEGGAVLDPPLSDAWAHAEALKLARVLHQSAKPFLSRWRG
jgi:hypothetical protein